MSKLLNKNVEEKLLNEFGNYDINPTNVNCVVIDKDKYTEAIAAKQAFLDEEHKTKLESWSIKCAKDVLFSDTTLNKHIDIASLPAVDVTNLSDTASDFEYFEATPLDCYKNELAIFVLWSDFLSNYELNKAKGRISKLEDFVSDYDSTELGRNLAILYSYGVQLSFNKMSTIGRPPALAAGALIAEEKYRVTYLPKYIQLEQNKDNLYKALFYGVLLDFYRSFRFPNKSRKVTRDDIPALMFDLKFNVCLTDEEFSSYTLIRCLNIALILFFGCEGKIDTLPLYLKTFILEPTRMSLNAIENKLHIYVTYFSEYLL